MNHLPEESAFKAALALRVAEEQKKLGRSEPDKFQTIEKWKLDEQLLAHIIDLLAISNWQRTGKPGGKPDLLTAKPTHSGSVSEGIDARAVLAKIGPQREQELNEPSE